jgi:two-component system, OmpR family, sensor histidine kinase KdpD
MSQSHSRADPDALLKRVQAEENQKKRGKLKIFLGYAAGVGKTYAMLEAAHQLNQDSDVVVAVVETHKRAETEALVAGLEVIPRKQIEYRGVILSEMDLDAVLKRHPRLALVDELAHTNAPGSRHPKRYQDIEELMQAGIDVYTTVNIQHIESLRDVVAQVTEIWMHETVPDSIIDMASEIELVDLPSEGLLKRLKEGKVYLPEQIASAADKFFRAGNLNALRELTLRTAANHVDEKMRAYMEAKSIPGPWPARERLLVFISSESSDANLVRSARRMSAQLNAEWFVVRVETPQNMILSQEQREKLAATLQLAEKLGAQIVILQGQSVPEVIIEYARTHNITKIVVGKPAQPAWKERFLGSPVDKIIKRSQGYDLYIIRDKGEPPISRPAPAGSVKSHPRNYFVALEILVIATLLAELLHTVLNPTNLIMIYVLMIVIAAVFVGLGPSILLSILGVLTFDFLFIPPYYSFSVQNIPDIFMLLTLLVVGIVISYLTAKFRQHTEAAWQRERQTESLYALSRDMAVSNDLESYIHAIVRRSKETFGREAVLYLPEAQNGEKLKPYAENPEIISNENDNAAALWAFEHRKIIGPGTDTLPNARASFFPLITARGIIGVLALFETAPGQELSRQGERLMEAYADLTAVSLEGILLAKESQNVEILKGTEKLQTAFLNAISHDLRTPLVSVIGAISSLQEAKADLDDNARDQLIQVARDEAEKLNHLITNLLDESRIEAGAVRISRQPSDLQDLIGSALEQLGARSNTHPINIDLPPDLPFVSVDSALIIQTLVNVLDNAINYSPASSLIEIKARLAQDKVVVEIADRGVGIPAQDLSRVFEKFYRVQQPENISGTGLGLSICKGFIEAHGGSISAENRPGGGIVVRFSLPVALNPAKAARSEG